MPYTYSPRAAHQGHRSARNSCDGWRSMAQNCPPFFATLATVRTRYGVIGDDVFQVSKRHGRRKVISRRSFGQSIRVGEFGRWLAVVEVWRAMGETETDIRMLDRQTLESAFWTRYDDDALCGRDGDLLVVATVFPGGKTRSRAWHIDSWEKVEGYQLPKGKRLKPLGLKTTGFGDLMQLSDASPLGRWTFATTVGKKRVTGVVEANERAVRIEDTNERGTLTRTIDEEFVPKGNSATWHGEHGGELVHVTIVALNETEAELTWMDGVTHAWELTLTR